MCVFAHVQCVGNTAKNQKSERDICTLALRLSKICISARAPRYRLSLQRVQRVCFWNLNLACAHTLVHTIYFHIYVCMYCDLMYKHMHNKRTYVFIKIHISFSRQLTYISIKSQPPDKYTRPHRNRLYTYELKFANITFSWFISQKLISSIYPKSNALYIWSILIPLGSVYMLINSNRSW